jgi:hypothetical protein
VSPEAILHFYIVIHIITLNVTGNLVIILIVIPTVILSVINIAILTVIRTVNMTFFCGTASAGLAEYQFTSVARGDISHPSNSTTACQVAQQRHPRIS